jgi:hypothetical protein
MTVQRVCAAERHPSATCYRNRAVGVICLRGIHRRERFRIAFSSRFPKLAGGTPALPAGEMPALPALANSSPLESSKPSQHSTRNRINRADDAVCRDEVKLNYHRLRQARRCLWRGLQFRRAWENGVDNRRPASACGLPVWHIP